MWKAIRSVVEVLVIIAAVVAALIIAKDRLPAGAQPLVTKVQELVTGSSPCDQPISYFIGSFDQRFGISRAQFAADIAKAANIWDGAIGKDLFASSSNGDLKIDLIYDYRQQATQELRSIGLTITNDKSSYDAAKAKYASLLATYDQDKASMEQQMSQYRTDKASFEQQAAYWNSQGGAPSSQYGLLEQLRTKVNAEADAINAENAALNSLGDQINAVVSALNGLASALNLNVSKYNTVGSSTGLEFDEGQYVSDQDGQRIDIYQFENNEKLVRVLAHELGHSLGLEHVNDPRAIMYYLNQSTNVTPTAADVAELKSVCGIN